jgi:hypothetical protein
MGLVKKASKLLRGVRRHRNDLRSPRLLKEEKLNIRSTGRIGRFIAKHKLRRRRPEGEAQTDRKPGNTTKAAMAYEYETEYMYEQGVHQMERPRVQRHMAQPQHIHIAEDQDEEEEEEEEDEVEEDDGGEGLSGEENDNDESEDEVEESVIEDMRKLEESFRGISRKYRLINRIGEGDLYTYTHEGPSR